MSKASECLSLFDDFTTAERAQPCPTCTFYNVTCLGNNHPRRPTDNSQMYFPVFNPRNVTDKVGDLLLSNRARLITVFDAQNTHLPPRGVMFDEDFVTTSELQEQLTAWKQRQGAFVDRFARTLRKMKDYEKAMLGNDNKCTLCERTNLSGYECITCHQWVCEFCFPQVMCVEVRTTLVILPGGVEETHLKCPYCRGLFNEPIGPSPRNSTVSDNEDEKVVDIE
eukprot:gene17882-25001_t